MRKLKPYDTVGYRTVVKGVLVRREGVTPELAEEIAQKLEGKSQDVTYVYLNYAPSDVQGTSNILVSGLLRHQA